MQVFNNRKAFAAFTVWTAAAAMALLFSGCGEVTAVASPGTGGDGDVSGEGGSGGETSSAGSSGSAGTGGTQQAMAGSTGMAGSNMMTAGTVGTGGSAPVTPTINVSTWLWDYAQASLQQPPGAQPTWPFNATKDRTLFACMFNNDMWWARDDQSSCSYCAYPYRGMDSIPADQLLASWSSASPTSPKIDMAPYSAGAPYRFSFNVNAPFGRYLLAVFFDSAYANPVEACTKRGVPKNSPLAPWTESMLYNNVSHGEPYFVTDVTLTAEVNVSQYLYPWGLRTGAEPVWPTFTSTCNHTPVPGCQ